MLPALTPGVAETALCHTTHQSILMEVQYPILPSFEANTCNKKVRMKLKDHNHK